MQLTQEQVEYINAEVQKAARQVMIGRRLLFTAPPIGFGAEVHGYDKLSEMAKGRIDLEWGAGFSEDTVGLARSKLPMAVLHKEFELNRRQVEASQKTGTPLPTSAVDAATYAVARQEDDLIVIGYSVDGTNYEIPGLYYGYGNSEDTSLDWGTPANILTSINNAITLLSADNIFGPYTEVVNPTQYDQLFAFVASTSTFYYDVAMARMSAAGPDGIKAPGRIFETPAIAESDGMILAPPERKLFYFQPGADLTVETTELEKSKNTWGIVYETATLAIPDANGICRQTVI